MFILSNNCFCLLYAVTTTMPNFSLNTNYIIRPLQFNLENSGSYMPVFTAFIVMYQSGQQVRGEALGSGSQEQNIDMKGSIYGESEFYTVNKVKAFYLRVKHSNIESEEALSPEI